MTRLLILVALLLGITATVTAQASGAASHLLPQHKETVKRWLAQKPNLRLATIADCSNIEGLSAYRKQFGKERHPYYVAGDFNRDKRADFAVVLVNKRKKELKFAVAIFNGPVGKASVPNYFQEGWDLSDGGLIVGDDGILAGPFESDNCVILRPRRKGYVIKDCLEE